MSPTYLPLYLSPFLLAASIVHSHTQHTDPHILHPGQQRWRVDRKSIIFSFKLTVLIFWQHISNLKSKKGRHLSFKWHIFNNMQQKLIYKFNVNEIASDKIQHQKISAIQTFSKSVSNKSALTGSSKDSQSFTEVSGKRNSTASSISESV